MSRLLSSLVTAALGVCLAGCVAAQPPAPEARSSPQAGTRTTESRPSLRPRAPEPVGEGARAARVEPSDGRPRDARLTIPVLGLRGLRVVSYTGSPDDAPGTRIQDDGVAASPHGAAGGVGPGGVGNYVVTAHRTSSTRAFAELPSLRRGDRVHVLAGRTRFTYRITGTRWTSFRSVRSLRRQVAAVPGRPGEEPERAMITLSTCATPEDHARGNYWSDELGNPEHRIDKIGVLVASRRR
jgi:sortase A